MVERDRLRHIDANLGSAGYRLRRGSVEACTGVIGCYFEWPRSGRVACGEEKISLRFVVRDFCRRIASQASKLLYQDFAAAYDKNKPSSAALVFPSGFFRGCWSNNIVVIFIVCASIFSVPIYDESCSRIETSTEEIR